MQSAQEAFTDLERLFEADRAGENETPLLAD